MACCQVGASESDIQTGVVRRIVQGVAQQPLRAIGVASSKACISLLQQFLSRVFLAAPAEQQRKAS